MGTLWSAFDWGRREVFWINMGGQNMMRTGLQSLFVLLLVVQAVQFVAGQDLSGVLSALQGQAGEVLVKGDADYESRRLVMNAACTDEPAVIVRPTSEEDVSVIIKAANDANMPISIRSGGHSYTCTNIKKDSVHIDMRGMDSIELTQESGSPTGLAAVLEAGATWGNVLRAIPTNRYSYPHGQCRSVGVAGYLLGGGVNWLGTYNKYGYGAENILSMGAVLADGRIVEVTAEKTEILSPSRSTVVHTESNNLFFALRGAGSSFGVVTQFKYIVHEVPEAKPAILLAWADNSDDLAAIKAAGQASPDYSVTISLEYAQDFWKNALASPIYRVLFPPIMRILRTLGRIRYGTNSYPVFLTVTDIRPEAGRTTEVQRAVDHVKSQGVRLVLEKDIAHRSGFPDPWCSTLADASGTHITGNFGDCASSCPVEQTSTTASPACSTTTGQSCVFPFTYNGVQHTACTLSGFPTPWCSTQTDGSGTHVTGNYGNCNADCPMEETGSNNPFPILGRIFGH